MSKLHGISWLNKPGFIGETWNPIVGCSIESAGCKNCYAMKMAHRIQAMQPASHYHGTTKVVNGKPVWAGKIVRASEKTLLAPLRWKKPRMVFVNSMGDLFHSNVPDNWIDQVMAVIALSPQHTFLVLTKHPERMQGYLMSIPDGYGGRILGLRDALIEGNAQGLYAKVTDEDPSSWLSVTLPLPNLWLGVSVENQKQADDRLSFLLNTPSIQRFVSVEPMLEPVDLKKVKPESSHARVLNLLDRRISYNKHSGKFYESPWQFPQNKLDWVIVGGESGKARRHFDPTWARDIRDQCASACVPFFMKQMGDGSAIPADLQIQQWPETGQ